jgi:hypothetical protein
MNQNGLGRNWSSDNQGNTLESAETDWSQPRSKPVRCPSWDLSPRSKPVRCPSWDLSPRSKPVRCPSWDLSPRSKPVRCPSWDLSPRSKPVRCPSWDLSQSPSGTRTQWYPDTDLTSMGSYERSNKTSGVLQGESCLDQSMDYQFLKEIFQWSELVNSLRQHRIKI